MTDHNTMTIDQCRDEIAEKVLGWRYDDDVIPRWIKGTEYEFENPAGPPTTDAALDTLALGRVMVRAERRAAKRTLFQGVGT